MLVVLLWTLPSFGKIHKDWFHNLFSSYFMPVCYKGLITNLQHLHWVERFAPIAVLRRINKLAIELELYFYQIQNSRIKSMRNRNSNLF